MDAKPPQSATEIASLRRVYLDRSSVLDIDSLPTRDPYKLWQLWFHEAVEKVKEAGMYYEPNQIALATASKDGAPSVRYVLLKGHDEKGFYFYTNYDSRKSKELAENPRASFCMYWPELHRSVRIEGTVEKVAESISDEYYSTRPVGSQIAAAVSPQSQPVASRQQLDTAMQQLQQQVESGQQQLQRPSNWGGYCIVPVCYEFWQGQRDRLHDRIRFQLAAGKWVCDRLAP